MSPFVRLSEDLLNFKADLGAMICWGLKFLSHLVAVPFEIVSSPLAFWEVLNSLIKDLEDDFGDRFCCLIDGMWILENRSSK